MCIRSSLRVDHFCSFFNGLVNTKYFFFVVLGFFCSKFHLPFSKNGASDLSTLLQKCICSADFTVAQRVCLLSCAQVLLRKLAFSFCSLCCKMLYVLPHSSGAGLEVCRQVGFSSYFIYIFFPQVKFSLKKLGLLLAFLHFWELLNSLMMITDWLDKARSDVSGALLQ